MSPRARRQCKPICNWSYSFKHFKLPTVSRRHLGTTPNLQVTFLFLHPEVNTIPNIELFVHPMLICIAFLSVLGCFQIMPDVYNLLLYLLEQFWTKHSHVHWIIPIHWCPTPPSIQIFIWTHPQGCLLYIVISKLYQV